MGAEWTPGEGVRFRVWAPAAHKVEVALYGRGGCRYRELSAEGDSLFAGIVREARPGTRYKFRLDGQQSYPDPYSRYQPDGVHGPSEVVDPGRYSWHDGAWTGISAAELIIYECHVGTYTPAGTFDALSGELGALRRLGITALELMPVAEFPGCHNWGYDGVDLYAPTRNYGGPDSLKRLVDAAHGVGLAVILDVVYNHLGPSGNYLRAFAPQYFTDRYTTPWGEALNYDGEDSRWVRQYVVQNACYWLNEFHVDGLRLDATHAIFDRSPHHILREIAEQARQSVAGERRVLIIAEDGNNDVAHIRSAAGGGRGLDAVWADDFHHALRAFLTGERDGYFVDYAGDLESVAKTVREGFLYQGQRSCYLGRPRGTPVTGEPAHRFVFCIQNHDQVGNRAFGDRLHHVIDQGRHLTAAALLVLVPETPLLFMGQEFAASAPFLYFTDHDPDLGRLVTAGRREEFRHFAAFSDPVLREQIPDPQAASTFQRSKLDLGERLEHAGVYRCYRDLLQIRRTDPVLSILDRRNLWAAALDEHVLAIHRWRDGDHRLLLANFGEGVPLPLSPQPSLPAIPAAAWQLLWSSAAPAYWDSPPAQPLLGPGTEPTLYIPPRSAALLRAAHVAEG